MASKRQCETDSWGIVKSNETFIFQQKNSMDAHAAM